MIKVGCCGYPVSQAKYYEAFTLVELNSTFYKYPRLSTVERWRARAPENFEFTVKAHQDISHRYRLSLEQCAEPFEKVKQICRILNGRVIVIQTPPSFTINDLEKAEKFFKGMNREDLILVWETRGPSWESENGIKKLKKVLSEVGVSHVVDPLRLMPAYVTDIAYFRLHGLGKRMYYYQYTNDELKRLYEIVSKFEGLKMDVYVLFNNLSMFEDAKRFLFYIKNRRFPPLLESSLNKIKSIVEKMRFPADKNMLMRKIGWRVIEIEGGKQIRLDGLLAKMPTKKYGSPDEVMKELEAKLKNL